MNLPDEGKLYESGEAFKPGEQIDGYEIVGLLGIGAMAEVWCARERSTGRLDALKILRSEDPEAQARFVEERRLLSSLSHPGIVHLFASGQSNGREWFTMELLQPLPEEPSERQVRRWALQLCDAVDELHRCGVLHRDIKRSNVMLRGKHLVLVDFGIVKALDGTQSSLGASHPTLMGAAHTVGTPGRSAPEIFEGVTLSPASDVYSIGMLVRDLLPNWQRYALWRRVMVRVLVTDPALRIPTPRALAAMISHKPIGKWIALWILPWLIALVAIAYRPTMQWWAARDWEFSRAGVYIKDRMAFNPNTVYTTLVFTEPVSEIALPDNTGGVIWCGGLAFERADTYQRVIFWSPSNKRKLLIGHVFDGSCPEHEIVLVGDIDFHCSNIHGFVPYPTPDNPTLLGKPFSETWVDHVRPVAPSMPVKLRRVATLEEARALPPPKKPIQYLPLHDERVPLTGKDTLKPDACYSDVQLAVPRCELTLPQNTSGIVWLSISDAQAFNGGAELTLINPGPKPLIVIGDFNFKSRPMTLTLQGPITLHDNATSGRIYPTAERQMKSFSEAWIERNSPRSAPSYFLVHKDATHANR